MSRVPGILARLALLMALSVLIVWPLIALVESGATSSKSLKRLLNSLGMSRSTLGDPSILGASRIPAGSSVLDPSATAEVLRDAGGRGRAARLAFETLKLVSLTAAMALPVGLILALLLFRTDVLGRRLMLALVTLAAFVPIPLHATAWLGALGNSGRMQAIGLRPILTGLFGAGVIHALACLPWVIILMGLGFRSVEPELEEQALLHRPAGWVLFHVTLRRGLGGIAASVLAVVVLTAGDMTVTDLLQVRTYAEEAYTQFILGLGPADAAVIAIPPMILCGLLVSALAWALRRTDPARFASAFDGAKTWRLGTWRGPLGMVLVLGVGNLIALPLYSLVWRAGRVGGRADLGIPPTWSLRGLVGTLDFALSDSLESLLQSLELAAISALFAVTLAWCLSWPSRRSTFWSGLTLGVLTITLAVPGPVVGMALKIAFQEVDWIADSPAILIMAEVDHSLPYVIMVIWPVVATLPVGLIDSAAMDGLGPVGQMIRLGLPLTRPAIVTGIGVAVVLGVGELPASNIVAPPGIMPITLLIWTLLHTGVESHLAGVALVMLGLVALLGGVAVRALTMLVDRAGRV